MKKVYLLISFIFLLLQMAPSQDGYKEIAKDDEQAFPKSEGIEDRAGGTHNASNIGLFFENRGKLYPRRITQGPSGEFPIGSGKHYIYRINPMVGVPGNVVQARYTTNEEWEALGGYHNRELAQIAFSDNPNTWHPVNGWPVKDAEGNPVILSDQDSYCAFSDSNNTVKTLGFQVFQTGYAYGVRFAEDLIIYKYEILNIGLQDLDSLYFGWYIDIDVGNISGGVPEYGDDLLGFEKDRNFIYFYDDGISTEWPGGVTGYFGAVMLQSPEINGQEPGITDLHYNLYFDDRDDDEIQYGILSSNTAYIPDNFVDDYFHPGNNPDLHYDDPATIPSSGLDLVANIGSGPYHLNRGDTLTFYMAIAGGIDYNDISANVDVAYQILNANFILPKPPETPQLTAVPGDNRVTLFWDDRSERSLDAFSGQFDFEGYRIYRSVDKGVHWDQIDRNVTPIGPEPVPIAEFDIVNNIPPDNGLQYSFMDSSVINGFEYWYTITSYDRGDSLVESLESPRGNTPSAINTVSVVPVSPAAGRLPVSSGDIHHRGNGISNYVVNITPVDNEDLGGNQYDLGFTFLPRREKGVLKTAASVLITDSSQTQPYRYGIEFTSASKFNLLNLTTGEIIRDGYNFKSGTIYTVAGHGIRIKLENPEDVETQFLPRAGDLLTINFSVLAVRNESDTVISPRPIEFGKPQATTDGVIFSILPPEIIQNVNRISGSDNVEMNFSVIDEASVEDNNYLLSVEGRGFHEGEGFVSLVIQDSQNVITTLDTLFNLNTFEFNGIQGQIQFPPDNPPAPGNVFAVSTIIPRPPNLTDSYQFEIRDAVINHLELTRTLEKIKVVPNPYIVSSLYEPEFGELRREPLRQLQFINLPHQCTIYIFTVAGDLVKTIEHRATHGTAVWDLRADGGREIATGIYIYLVKAADAEFLSRFAVIK